MKVRYCPVLCSYANSESYRRALEDFDAALAINPDHTNAQKYACDTLLALARRYILVAEAICRHVSAECWSVVCAVMVVASES